MRITLFICCMALLAACHNEAEKPAPAATEGAKKDSKYAGILAKCKAIEIDTFRVHYDENVNESLGVSDNYPFKGVLLDSAEAALFPPEVASGPMENSSGVYACYSFAIDAGHTGIIARTPSMYESMSVKLFTLDNDRDTLTDFTELATFEGDDGEMSEKTAWLYRNDKKNLNAYIRLQDTYDHSVQDDGDTTVDRTNYYYVLDVSKPKYDTINRNAASLLKTFQALNRK